MSSSNGSSRALRTRASTPGTRSAQDLQRALVDVHAGDVLGAEQLGQPAQVAADVAADLERRADLERSEHVLPERPPPLAAARLRST